MSNKKSATKTAAIFVLVALVASMMGLPVHAVDSQPISPASYQTIAPAWADTTLATAGISASNRVLTCSAVIRARLTTTRISGTMYLEQNVNGSWRSVTSWAISGTGSVSSSRTYTGTSGVTYRTRVVATVGSDHIDVVSSTVRA